MRVLKYRVFIGDCGLMEIDKNNGLVGGTGFEPVAPGV
jgi:hypothetical protein